MDFNKKSAEENGGKRCDFICYLKFLVSSKVKDVIKLDIKLPW